MADGNVLGCPDHTWLDDRTGERFRSANCNAWCRAKQAQDGPLTKFLIKLLKYKDSDLIKADASKAASVYGIDPKHAAGYIGMERERRGLKGEAAGGLCEVGGERGTDA
jgi:hypothetical protein